MQTAFPDISPHGLIYALADARAPALLDIRLDEDVAALPGMIPTALPVAFTDLETPIALARPNGAIVICHKGLKLSAGVTARLRAHGVAAWRLAGGQTGWDAARLPVLHDPAPIRLALPLDPAPDEAAAAWAICRFIAPRAETLQVPRDDLPGVLERFDAVQPALGDAPALPGLLTLLQDVTQPGSLFADQLAGAPIDVAFACLDAAYRGALLRTCHESFTQGTASLAISLQQEARP